MLPYTAVDLIRSVNVTNPVWPDRAISAGREPSLPISGSSVELQVRTGIPSAEQYSARIVVLHPHSAVAQAIADQLRADINLHDGGSSEYAGAWFRLGLPEDEEPTWEDAAWQ